MLAESGKRMTTYRTAIRRGLAVRRPSHRPPWGARKTGHGFILAPLAATMAATLVATVTVGVGVMLAKAERDRRVDKARRSRDRRFGLLPRERLPDGCKRMALGQLDLAIELLQGGGEVPAERTVHETRKALKRLRALMRLLRDELGEKAFARENAVLRDAGRRLAYARDAEVMVSTLDELLKRHPRKLANRSSLIELRRALVAEREEATERAFGDDATRTEVLSDLRAARARVAQWSLPDRPGIELVERALKRLYLQGQRRRRRAGRSSIGRGKGTGNARAMHEWRKRVKDLRYAAEMLDREDPGGPDNGARRKRGKRKRTKRSRVPSKRIRRLARRADELGELLGEEHDLALLAARMDAPGEPLVGRKTRKVLRKLIARHRRRLRRRALREGERLYRRRPKRFVRRVRSAYARASRA
jgi:CHAD domain-containing protein